jgi:hypothetical protein
MFIAIAVLATNACSQSPGRLVVRTVADTTGNPLAGVSVQVAAQPWSTTDAEGKATFDAVPGLFTVRVHSPGQVLVLSGRTGPEVVAEVPPPEPSQWHFAHTIGSVGGRSASTTVVHVGFAPFKDWSTWKPATVDGSFDMFIGWRGLASESATRQTLHAWESDAANPAGHYYGFGRSGRLPLQEDSVTTGVSLSLTPVSQATVESTVSLPAGITASEVLQQLSLVFGRYEQLTLGERIGPPGNFTSNFSWIVPSVAGAQAWISVWAGGSWHRRLVGAPSGQLVFVPPVRPELLEPATGSAIGNATFRWSAPETGGSSLLWAKCNWTDSVAGNASLTYSVEAESTDGILPVIPGISVPPGSACQWTVRWCAGGDTAVEERCSEPTLRAATW